MTLTTLRMVRKMSNYKQYDTRWATLGYPRRPWYIRNCGCGEVAICNTINLMDAHASDTPKTIQPYMKQFAESRGNGTYHYGIPRAMAHYGMTDVYEHSTMQKLFAELAKGNRVAILLMGSRKAGSKGVHWTGSGHFVAVTAYKKEGGKNWVYVKDSASTSSLRNGWITYEDNIKGACLKCWSGKLSGKKATVKTEKKTEEKLAVDGLGGKATVSRLQAFLGVSVTGGITIKKDLHKYVPSLISFEYGDGSPTVKALQKWLGITQDGLWGSGTSKALQKKLDLSQDGIFSTDDMKALQTYLNEHDKAVYAKTNAQKIVDQAKAYAWAYGTAEKKWAYSTGSATSAYKTALKKYMNKSGKEAQSDCGYFVSTCVRSAGVDSDFLALKGVKDKFPPVPKEFKLVHSGSKVPSGLLQAGDIIRYKKDSGSQHALIYLGDSKIAEGGRKIRFPVIRKDTKKYNDSAVKHSTLQVLRAR